MHFGVEGTFPREVSYVDKLCFSKPSSLLALFPVILSVFLHEIEKLTRHFLWDSTDGTKKFHLVV